MIAAPAIVTLDYIVNQVMLDLDEGDTRNYLRYLQWGIWILSTELAYKYSQTIKVAYLTLNDVNIAELPSDFIDYTKIGYCCGGHVITLSLNNNIALPRKLDECGTLETCISDCCGPNFQGFAPALGYYPFAGHFRNGQFVGELYGVGGGFNRAYYRIDWEKRQIKLEGTVPRNEIILEYKSNGINPDGSIPVDPKLKGALRQYILWQRVEHNSAAPANEKERKMSQFYLELHKLVDLKSSFTADEYLDMVHRRSKLTPQR